MVTMAALKEGWLEIEWKCLGIMPFVRSALVGGGGAALEVDWEGETRELRSSADTEVVVIRPRRRIGRRKYGDRGHAILWWPGNRRRKIVRQHLLLQAQRRRKEGKALVAPVRDPLLAGLQEETSEEWAGSVTGAIRKRGRQYLTDWDAENEAWEASDSKAWTEG